MGITAVVTRFFRPSSPCVPLFLVLVCRCPFPPVLGPLVLGRLEPPKDLAVFPVRASGGNIQVCILSALSYRIAHVLAWWASHVHM